MVESPEPSYVCFYCKAPIVRGERCGSCGRGWLLTELLTVDYHGDAMDVFIEASNRVVSFRRHGDQIRFGITPGAVVLLTAEQAADIAANLHAAARAAKGETR